MSPLRSHRIVGRLSCSGTFSRVHSSTFGHLCDRGQTTRPVSAGVGAAVSFGVYMCVVGKSVIIITCQRGNAEDERIRHGLTQIQRIVLVCSLPLHLAAAAQGAQRIVPLPVDCFLSALSFALRIEQCMHFANQFANLRSTLTRGVGTTAAQ